MKACTKCKTEYAATTEYFCADRSKKDNLYPSCKICSNKEKKRHYANNREKLLKKQKLYQSKGHGKLLHKEAMQKYRKTFNGHIRRLLNRMKYRCTAKNDPRYKDYGGRGIELKITFEELFTWCVNNKVDPRGLQVDRIDNDGNYSLDNIQFVTAKENCNNRRKPKRKGA